MSPEMYVKCNGLICQLLPHVNTSCEPITNTYRIELELGSKALFPSFLPLSGEDRVQGGFQQGPQRQPCAKAWAQSRPPLRVEFLSGAGSLPVGAAPEPLGVCPLSGGHLRRDSAWVCPHLGSRTDLIPKRYCFS